MLGYVGSFRMERSPHCDEFPNPGLHKDSSIAINASKEDTESSIVHSSRP
jgi:hypothetical protein